MDTTTLPAASPEDVSGWERALYAFLAEKERRSGSRRTVEGYARMLRHFFGAVAPAGPHHVAGRLRLGLRRRELRQQPSSVTIGARLACLSSFYRFLIRMGAVDANPCDALERPRVSPSPPRGLSAEEVRSLLDAIPETPSGLRDRAIVLTLVLTGRRRAEVLNLRAGDLSVEEGRTWYRYRGKGGKTGRLQLRPCIC
jgi:site-specific recombinase XerC